MKPQASQVFETLFNRHPALEDCRGDILAAAEVLLDSWSAGGKLLICGNGGSAADSVHIVGELLKAFAIPRPLPADAAQAIRTRAGDYAADRLQGALPALSLAAELGLTTAFANDVAPDLVFAQQVYGLGRTGDALLAISTSGNSANVMHAVQVADALGIRTIGLTGALGGKLATVANVVIRVPETEVYKIQELHLPVYHALCLAAEQEFFG
ncbi:MAG: SIS domain-containing protein [Propionibacteriaceae bacterium]|jgi:D-sedoheptulose 7-phosphate isomerase|nr:SIS domain-containing protein [Propionibacteriaceae bacterium]